VLGNLICFMRLISQGIIADSTMFSHKFSKKHSSCENNAIILIIPFHRISHTFMLLIILLTIYSYLKYLRIFLVFPFKKINSRAYYMSIIYVKIQSDREL
jgi:hypothetical protein